MAEQEEKSSPFCFTNQASFMDVSRGRKNQPKPASVFQDTTENIVKHVSGETVLEKFYFRRCQTKYMTSAMKMV